MHLKAAGHVHGQITILAATVRGEGSVGGEGRVADAVQCYSCRSVLHLISWVGGAIIGTYFWAFVHQPLLLYQLHHPHSS